MTQSWSLVEIGYAHFELFRYMHVNTRWRHARHAKMLLYILTTNYRQFAGQYR